MNISIIEERLVPGVKIQRFLKGKLYIANHIPPWFHRTYDVIEAPFRNPDGSISKLRMFHDITEQLKVDESLRESEERYRSLVEETDDLITRVDLNGRFIFCNHKSHILGVDKDQCVGLVFFDFIHPGDYKRSVNWFHECISNHVDQSSLESRQVNSKTGTITDMLWTSKFYYDTEGSLKSIDSIAYNITDRKKAEDKVKKLLNEKEVLLKEIHHRIKNNMHSIRALLFMQSSSIEIPEAVSVLQDAIARIESMEILYDKLYRSESYENISIKEYLSQLIDEIVQIFPGRNIIIKKQIGDFFIRFKIIYLLGILINELLTNAMKYAFTGKSNGILFISLEKENNHITLIFEDNGVGMWGINSEEEAKGFGMELIDAMVDQIGDSYQRKSHRGTKYIFNFYI